MMPVGGVWAIGAAIVVDPQNSESAVGHPQIQQELQEAESNQHKSPPTQHTTLHH